MSDWKEAMNQTIALDKVMSGEFRGVTGVLTNEEYQKAPGLSYSGLKEFAKTPAHYQAYLKRERKQTPSQVVGELFHLAVLEPERFEKQVVPVENRLTKANKEMIEAAEEAGKFVCTTKEYDHVVRMAKAVAGDPLVAKLLQGGLSEQSMFWVDQATGVLCKCRFDRISFDHKRVLDLKHYDDLDQSDLERQIHRQKYHWQSAWYLDGASELFGEPTNMFVHLFVTPEDPYLVRPAVLLDPALEKARAEYRPLLEKFAQCQKTNEWPGYEKPETGILELGLPAYAW